MSECKCCGETYSLTAYVTCSLSIYGPMIDGMRGINPSTPALSEQRDKLMRSLVDTLRHELTSALELERTGLCGLCAIAAQPTACGTCWSVALGDQRELVANDMLQAELRRRSVMLVERGIASDWHTRKGTHDDN